MRTTPESSPPIPNAALSALPAIETRLEAALPQRAEEKLLDEKLITGKAAFGRLFEETISA